MNRDEIRDRFSALLDGELDADERAEIEAVLAQDAELLRELDSLKRVDTLYRGLPRPTAPEGFESEVHKRVHAPRIALPVHHTRRRLWPSLAAAAMLLLTAGFVLYQMREPSTGFDIASTKTPVSKPLQSAPTVMFDSLPEARTEQVEQQLSALGYARAEADDEGKPEQQAPEAAASEMETSPRFDPAEGAGLQRRLEKNSSDVPVPSRAGTESHAQGRAGQMRQKEVESAAAETPMAAADAVSPVDIPAPAPASPTPASTPAPVEEKAEAEPTGKRERFGKKLENDRAMTEELMSRNSLPSETKRRIADRDFELRAEVLYQSDYNGEPTIPIVRGTKAADDLLEGNESLEAIFKQMEPIVFKLGDRWYKLSSPK